MQPQPVPLDQQLQEVNRLLAEASALLIDAVEYEAPLTTLAQLAVPQLADWCVVHLLQADGSIEQVALAPAETARLQAAYDWLQNHLPNDHADGLPAVLRSGEPKLVTDVASNLWAAAAAIKSYMIVPLVARRKPSARSPLWPPNQVAASIRTPSPWPRISSAISPSIWKRPGYTVRVND